MQLTGQCPRCFSVNSHNATDCIDCGARLPWADKVQSQPPPPGPAPGTAKLNDVAANDWFDQHTPPPGAATSGQPPRAQSGPLPVAPLDAWYSNISGATWGITLAILMFCGFYAGCYVMFIRPFTARSTVTTTVDQPGPGSTTDNFTTPTMLAPDSVASAPNAGTTTGSACPAGEIYACNDGSYSEAQHRQGACSHHGGIAYNCGAGGVTTGGVTNSDGMAHTITYRVTGSGRGFFGTYDSAPNRQVTIPDNVPGEGDKAAYHTFPWETSVQTAIGSRELIFLNADGINVNDPPLTAEILVDGQVVASHTGDGADLSVGCDENGCKED